MNIADLQALAASVGFPDPALAAAIAMAESRGNPTATNIVTNPAPGNGPERSFGLWQINTLAHPSYNESSLLDPTYNANAALQVSSQGSNWNPWSTYTSGIYKQFLTTYTPAGTPQPPSLVAPLALGALIIGGGLVAAHFIRRPVAGRYALENPLPCPGSSRIQSLLFPRSRFTVPAAKSWTRKHGYSHTAVDLKPATIRIRQEDPSHFSRLRTISLGDGGVRAVIGWGRC